MLLSHDAERHGPNTAMMTSKIADERDLIYFNNNIEQCVNITSISNEIFLYYLQEREGVTLAASHCCLWQCLLVAILANPCQSPHIGRLGGLCPINECVAIGMGWSKRPPKSTRHGEAVVVTISLVDI